MYYLAKRLLIVLKICLWIPRQIVRAKTLSFQTVDNLKWVQVKISFVVISAWHFFLCLENHKPKKRKLSAGENSENEEENDGSSSSSDNDEKKKKSKHSKKSKKKEKHRKQKEAKRLAKQKEDETTVVTDTTKEQHVQKSSDQERMELDDLVEQKQTNVKDFSTNDRDIR